MPTPAASVPFAVRGQLFNLSAPVRSNVTGNPVGGLTNLRAVVSKDDGAFVATTNAPVERGASGWVSLDLTATEMTASKIDVEIRADNSAAMYTGVSIAPLDLSGSYTGTYLGQTYLRLEQMLKNVWGYLFNRNVVAGAGQTLLNDAGIPMASAVIVEDTGSADKGALR